MVRRARQKLLSGVDSTFGRIASRENYKPIRYLSTGPNGSGTYIDNAYCRFGFVTGTPASGSTESSLIAIRSGVDCYHEGAAGSGFCIGNIVQYAADIGHHTVDRNTVSFIGGVFPSTGMRVMRLSRRSRHLARRSAAITCCPLSLAASEKAACCCRVSASHRAGLRLRRHTTCCWPNG